MTGHPYNKLGYASYVSGLPVIVGVTSFNNPDKGTRMRFSDMNKEFEFLNLSKKSKKTIVPYKYKMFCDGGSRNGKEAAIGIIAYSKNDSIVISHSEYIGNGSCNVAEYVDLYTGLILLREQGIEEVNIYMDSDLVVHQVNGLWKCKHPNMILLCDKVKSLLKKFKWTLSWIPRDKNKEADGLVNQAFRERSNI